MQAIKLCAVVFVFSVVELEAVTVNPIAHLCPTNKIAPRHKRYDYHPRTFGEFYNLLAPNSHGSLYEKPQEEEIIDCSEIEDYDENDIASVTQRPIRRQGYERKAPKPSHQHLLHQHNQQGIKPSTTATRPPPAGYFGTNTYNPPKPLKPTDYQKPVAEGGDETQTAYRPGIVVGAPLYHVVGLPQKQGRRTTTPPSSEPNHREPKFYTSHSYLPVPPPNANKHHRPRKFNGDTGILGSFVDLFF